MTDAPLRPTARARHVVWAALLSLVEPGLGQVYAGAWRLGAVLFVVAIALTLGWTALTWRVAPTPGAIAASAAVLLLYPLTVAVDAARRVRSQPLTRNPWYRSAWLAAPLMVALNVGVQSIDDIARPGWRSFHSASASNLPTLLTSDYFLVDLRSAGTVPAYGDIVVFRSPGDPKVDYVKRVVGLAGDRVQLRDGILYVNGNSMPREQQGFVTLASAPAVASLKQYRETLPNGRSYMIAETPQSASQSTPEFAVPPGTFFVLGDNRGNSLDSRATNIGYIPVANVIGTVRTIYWTTLSEPGRFLSSVR